MSEPLSEIVAESVQFTPEAAALVVKHQKLLILFANGVAEGIKKNPAIEGLLEKLAEDSDRLNAAIDVLLTAVPKPKKAKPKPAPKKRSGPRFDQAKKLFDKGFGTAFGSFEAYLATIPEVPKALLAPDAEFPHLVLVDPRPGVTETCKLLGIGYGGDDEFFEDFDAKKSRPMTPYWIRAQDGARNRGKSVRACRKAFAEREIGLTVLEGLALFAQDPKFLKGFAWDLPGSVRRGCRDGVACLCWFGDRPDLSWSVVLSVHSKFGSASVREFPLVLGDLVLLDFKPCRPFGWFFISPLIPIFLDVPVRF